MIVLNIGVFVLFPLVGFLAGYIVGIRKKK